MTIICHNNHCPITNEKRRETTFSLAEGFTMCRKMGSKDITILIRNDNVDAGLLSARLRSEKSYD